MEPEELRRLLKKTAIIASFFVLALLFYLLNWRFALVIYTQSRLSIERGDDLYTGTVRKSVLSVPRTRGSAP